MVLRPAWRHYWLRIGIGVLFIIIFLISWAPELGILGILGLSFLLSAIWARFARLYIISSETLTARLGLVSIKEIKINLRDIRSLTVKQNILERALNVGKLAVATAGTSGYEAILEGILDPFTIRGTLKPSLKA